MRFGVCCGLEEAALAVQLGYDYVELGASAIAAAEDLGPYRELPIEATNLFFPGGFSLYGERADEFREYAPRAIEKVASLGAKVMVVGSGAARNAPVGVDLATGEARFVDVVCELQFIADGFGIKMAPESLNRTETNVGNDLGQLAIDLDSKGVAYTADLYHVLYEANADGHAPDFGKQLPFAPLHVHLADLPRNVPALDDAGLLGFANRLAELGYGRRISLECSRPDPAKDLARALEVMRATFK